MLAAKVDLLTESSKHSGFNPSKKYEFVSWDDHSQYMESHYKFHGSSHHQAVTVFFPQNTETRVGGFAYCEASIEGPFVPNGFPKIRGFNRGFPRKPPSHHPPIRLACAHLHRASVKKRNRIDMNGNCAIWCPQQLWLAYKPNKESIKYISIYVYDLRCGSTVPFNLEVHSAITAWMAGQARRIIPAALRQWSGACPLQCRSSLSFAPWAAGIHSYTFWTAGNQRWQWRTSYKWRL